MATSSQKSNYRYLDYYCYMSFADFTAYIARDDDDGTFPIGREEQGRSAEYER